MKSFKAILPNILTFTNMSLGVVAILLAVNETDKRDYLIYASLLILIAAFTDRLDGKVARLLNVTSDLGKELDSLSDLISFGVAPMIITWKISFIPLGLAGYLLSLIFPIAGAYRLARYNITTFDSVYTGVPITIAGAFLTIDNLYNCFSILNNKYTAVNTIISILLVMLLSYMMISHYRIHKV